MTRPRRLHWWAVTMPLLTLASVVAIPALVLYGYQAVRDSTDGTVRDVVTDPAAPGYEVVVTPTPTLLSLVTDEAGQLAGAALLTLSAESTGGSIVFMPAEVVVAGDSTLAELHADAGPDATRQAVAEALGIAIAEHFTFAATGWPELVAPLGTIDVTLTDPLVAVDAAGAVTTIYPSGDLQLGGADVAPFLGWLNPGETPLNRLQRHEKFWRAWLEAIGDSSDPEVVPGEVGAGIGRFVDSLARGSVREERLPLSVDPATPDRFAIDRELLGPVVASAVPFPTGFPPGSRPRTRVLDGAGRGLEALAAFARDLAAAGAEPVVLGNAQEFGRADSTVIYHDERWDQVAVGLADLLGQTDLSFDPLDESPFDITIVVGASAPEAGEGD